MLDSSNDRSRAPQAGSSERDEIQAGGMQRLLPEIWGPQSGVNDDKSATRQINFNLPTEAVTVALPGLTIAKGIADALSKPAKQAADSVGQNVVKPAVDAAREVDRKVADPLKEGIKKAGEGVGELTMDALNKANKKVLQPAAKELNKLEDKVVDKVAAGVVEAEKKVVNPALHEIDKAIPAPVKTGIKVGSVIVRSEANNMKRNVLDPLADGMKKAEQEARKSWDGIAEFTGFKKK